MSLLTFLYIAIGGALVVGFVLGWFIGRRAITVTVTQDAARDAAYRENALVDFEAVRNKANEIVRLANDITTRATRAHDTVLDPHRDLADQPRAFRPATTEHAFDSEVGIDTKRSLSSSAGENTSTEIVNSSGSYVGTVKIDGDVIQVGGTYVGRVKPDRDVVDSGGTYIGRVKPDGDVVDRHGSYVGRTKSDGDIVNASGSYIGRTKPPSILHGGAARLLLLP